MKGKFGKEFQFRGNAPHPAKPWDGSKPYLGKVSVAEGKVLQVCERRGWGRVGMGGQRE